MPHILGPTSHQVSDEAPGPVVAILGPAVQRTDLVSRIRQAGATAVPLVAARGSDGEAAALVAALACDLVVVELAASVGLDGQTPRIWERLGFAGMPRVVVVSGLGAGATDFDDLAAIAQRVLGEDAVPVRLPVFDDDEKPVASLDLRSAVVETPTGPFPAEAGHLTVAAGDLSALVSVVAASVVDDDAAANYIMLLAELANDADQSAAAPEVGEANQAGITSPSGTIHLGMPGVPHSGAEPPLRAAADQGATLPAGLGADVADAVSEGLLCPIVVDTPDGGWLRDIHAWGMTASSPADRLVRRDAHNDPTDGWAGVVLAVDGETALLRPVFGSIEAGYALITAVGCDEDSTPVPHRAWPTDLRPIGDHPDDGDHHTPRWWATTVRMSVGDTVAGRHVWLVPAE